MNLKTTIILLVIVVVGGIFWLLTTARSARSGSAASVSEAVLQKDLQPGKLTRIDIVQGNKHWTLERSPGGEWTMPGNWPTRKPEVEELVALLGNLHTRFTPISLNESNK